MVALMLVKGEVAEGEASAEEVEAAAGLELDPVEAFALSAAPCL